MAIKYIRDRFFASGNGIFAEKAKILTKNFIFALAETPAKVYNMQNKRVDDPPVIARYGFLRAGAGRFPVTQHNFLGVHRAVFPQ